MDDEEPFRNNELKLQKLAKGIEVQPSHLSQVINQKLELSFFDFINGYRIEYAKKLLMEDTAFEQGILQIAFSSGFNNITSFNKYFKKHTGTTPSKFRKINRK